MAAKSTLFKTTHITLLCMAFIPLITTFAAFKSQPANRKPDTRQLLVVLTDGWNTVKARLYGFGRRNGKWVLQFQNQAVVGRNGLGKGDGIVNINFDDVPVKKEGDGKSPAGIFSIGTAFGYAEEKDVKWIKNPYIRTFDTLICIDDIHSRDYNRLVNKDSIKTAFNSFEYMHRTDEYYKWGLFINHNTENTVPGDGSCIFMHIWKNNHTGTAGCTAMQEKNMLRIMYWINASDHPLLVQMPASEYKKWRRAYGFPAITYKHP